MKATAPWRVIALGCLFSTAAVLEAFAQGPADKTLPPGAVRRLGSEKLRHAKAGAVAYSRDGKIVVTGGHDIRLWDAQTRRLLRTIPLDPREIDLVAHLHLTAD